MNWDGQEVRVEAVLYAALHRTTRTYYSPHVPRILDAAARRSER